MMSMRSPNKNANINWQGARQNKLVLGRRERQYEKKDVLQWSVQIDDIANDILEKIKSAKNT